MLETLLGGVLAALAGLVPWFVQRRIESDEKRKEGHWTRWDDGLAKAIQTCNEQLSLMCSACSSAFDATDDADALAKGWAARRAFIHSINVGAVFFEDDLVLSGGLDEVETITHDDGHRRRGHLQFG